MIDSEWRRRNNNQFNWCFLNVQDKIDCNKINEIREEKIANLIYTGSTTSHAYFQSSSNPLDCSLSLYIFYRFRTHFGISHPCVQDSLRDNQFLDYNSHNPRDNQSLDYNSVSEMNRKISLL